MENAIKQLEEMLSQRGPVDREKLLSLLNNLQKEGLLLKKEYGLSPIDTIGSSLYQVSQ